MNSGRYKYIRKRGFVILKMTLNEIEIKKLERLKYFGGNEFGCRKEDGGEA